MEIKDILPVGSVVLLKDGKKKLVIVGVKQTDTENPGKEYDYLGVFYPEGHLGGKFQFLFNHDDIGEVFFRGYEDEERELFLTKLEEYYKN